ncbi:Carboxyl/Cholinesterase 02 [Frankliniella occidentalis]|nr:Carboxyl/Cholinesterase 02 [Frankliniella occidentalis]
MQRNEITPAVKIAQGELTGLFQTSTANKKYMAFYGIPYARPPVGDLRFKAPQPAVPWEGVRAAQTEGDFCPQPAATNIMKPQASVKTAADALKMVASLPGAARHAAKHMLHMSEDCLYLNVYTPLEALPVDKPLPVLVWIHDGGFVFGSGDYNMQGPEHLMDRGVVLVTLNYRLGAFGFLSSNSSDAPGNAGLKDQRLALRWVQDNIRHFGGDPGMVTLYGSSAGAVSAHAHVLSANSKGLFQAAILSSGSTQDFGATQADAELTSRQLAHAMGAGADTCGDTKRRIQFLRDAPFKDIVAGMKHLMASSKTNRNIVERPIWAPVVEPADGGEPPVLDRHPNDILVAGDFNTEVPLVIGVNDKEGSFIVGRLAEDDTTKLEANPSLLLLPNLYDQVDANTREELSTKIKNLYLKDQDIGKEALDSLADIYGDQSIVHGTHVATHWHLKHAKAPIFLYYFTLDAFGVASFLFGTKSLKGAGHGDDVGYVFKNHLVSDMGTSDKERFDLGVSRMNNLIANFVSQRRV